MYPSFYVTFFVCNHATVGDVQFKLQAIYSGRRCTIETVGHLLVQAMEFSWVCFSVFIRRWQVLSWMWSSAFVRLGHGRHMWGAPPRGVQSIMEHSELQSSCSFIDCIGKSQIDCTVRPVERLFGGLVFGGLLNERIRIKVQVSVLDSCIELSIGELILFFRSNVMQQEVGQHPFFGI